MTNSKHEVFEIETLDLLNKGGLLRPLVFGGGTMLRLCRELPRYSVDLDFWFLKAIDAERYFSRIQSTLAQRFEITDAAMEFYTLLVELRSPQHPRRLKIEIRREPQPCDWETAIAFSRFAVKQVLLITHTLTQCMINKVEALQSRSEIRDAFDLEFLMRRGVALPPLAKETVSALIDKISSFADHDFKVALGALLEPQLRDFYNRNRFSFVLDKLRFANFDER